MEVFFRKLVPSPLAAKDFASNGVEVNPRTFSWSFLKNLVGEYLEPLKNIFIR